MQIKELKPGEKISPYAHGKQISVVRDAVTLPRADTFQGCAVELWAVSPTKLSGTGQDAISDENGEKIGVETTIEGRFTLAGFGGGFVVFGGKVAARSQPEPPKKAPAKKETKEPKK